MSVSERRPRIVKVKDLKPKRIKDYLEYKFSRKSPTLLKLLYFMTSRKRVDTVHVRDQKHELTPPRNRRDFCQGRTRCLYSRHPLCHPIEAEYRSSFIEEVEALTVDSEAIID
ncbi:hypothetical protein GQ457_18G007940 [Hibiscus cannabinus]